jgi:tripartite-type tricarboxylate transporter receptor subunit TctC
MTHIPYKGSAPGLVALIGGEVIGGFTDMVISLPHVKSGRLRALAVTGATRSALVPELPTIAEAGLRGYSFTAWFALLAPSATPPEIITRINAEIARSLRTPQIKERLAATGALYWLNNRDSRHRSRFLEERRQRLKGISSADRRARVLRFLRRSVWPSIPKSQLGRRLTREE